MLSDKSLRWKWSMASHTALILSLFFLLFHVCFATVGINETPGRIDVFNERFRFSVNKSTGFPDRIQLDNVDLLGTLLWEEPVPGGPTGNGYSGIGPYLDCYCVLEGNGNYAPGSNNAEYYVMKDQDTDRIDWAGVLMSEFHPRSGQLMEQYWFLRSGETGLHTFSRIVYPKNARYKTRQDLQEFRTLFRPNTPLWTHISTNDNLYAPLLQHEKIHQAQKVQDATWDLSKFGNEPYVQDFNKYFTKYTFADPWRDHTVHGMFGDGSMNPPGANGTWGAWLVMNSRDTYYGGPTHTDLTVDGNVYNYMVSNHHGASVPELGPGFDRTFGPAYYYFNHGAPGSSLQESRSDAARFADPTWAKAFYNNVARHVQGYVPPSNRGTFRAKVKLPPTASKPIAILSASELDFQDNSYAPDHGQYWVPIDANGNVDIPMVVPGVYRLTLLASGIFGEYIEDHITIAPDSLRNPRISVTWYEESLSRDSIDVWRLGNPDSTSGEFRHGYARDLAHKLQPQEYRIFWGAYDFVKDFPDGVRFRIGESVEARDWNYVHWSNFNGQRGAKIRDWHILWTQNNITTSGRRALLTIQLAAAKTLSGNSHIPSVLGGKGWSDLVYKVIVNKKPLEPWRIPYTHSSNCAVRSGISCYNTGRRFEFDAGILREGENEIILRMPAFGEQEYVQYDALRLEVG